MLGNVNWNTLIPTKCSAVVFVSYIIVYINHGILVTASQSSQSTYSYNTVTVVLLTEVIKLLGTIIFYVKDHAVQSLAQDVKKHAKMLILYFVPAFLYCVCNNLAFINLSAFDPITYNLLLQFRVVVTGIVFQLLFHKQLSGKQWLSLILLTMGCMIEQLDVANFANYFPVKKGTLFSVIHFTTENLKINMLGNVTTNSNSHFSLNMNIMLIFVQILCSCFACVYSEYLLKYASVKENIFVQNVFMYADSIVCNAGLLFLQGNPLGAFSTKALSFVFTFKVLIIIINNAAAGIITSFFLKNLNSILKTFASTLAFLFTVVFCYIIFGTPLYVHTILAILIVSYAVCLYLQNPVVNQSKEHFVLVPSMSNTADDM